ncbi:hypothetical protein C1646_773555 [Rhizophagus diaphanus]|nr:hypothetical protein C1646_773555 [Rhizophagus diaphanus] [Rhizophagus sp. MUCL 43196]
MSIEQYFKQKMPSEDVEFDNNESSEKVQLLSKKKAGVFLNEWLNIYKCRQQEHSSSNTYYNNVNSDPFLNDNIFHTNNNYTDQQSTSNENIASTSQSYPLSFAPQQSQHGHPQLPAENTSFPHNSFNITSIAPSHSEILSFDIP